MSYRLSLEISSDIPEAELIRTIDEIIDGMTPDQKAAKLILPPLVFPNTDPFNTSVCAASGITFLPKFSVGFQITHDESASDAIIVACQITHDLWKRIGGDGNLYTENVETIASFCRHHRDFYVNSTFSVASEIAKRLPSSKIIRMEE